MSKRTPIDENLEVEASLIICSRDPSCIARQIADLPSMQNYRLLRRGPQTFRDHYLDTSSRELEAQELGLRIRETAEATYITLKGQGRPTGSGGVERLEIERPWSRDSLRRIVKEINQREIRLYQQQKGFDPIHPLDVMMKLGLVIVQERETTREVRNVALGGRMSVLAELGIDSVVFHFEGQKIYHYEVEIEAKVKDASSVLEAMINGLVSLYGSELRRWNHSKLATGMAIQKLVFEGGLTELIDKDNKMKPIAYDKIDEHLKPSGF